MMASMMMGAQARRWYYPQSPRPARRSLRYRQQGDWDVGRKICIAEPALFRRLDTAAALTHGYRCGGIGGAAKNQPGAHPLDGNIVLGNKRVHSGAGIKRMGLARELSGVEKPFSQALEVFRTGIARLEAAWQ